MLMSKLQMVKYNRFIPCEEDRSCQEWDDREGYTYIGDISVEDDGNYQIEFSGEGNVVVLETDIGGFLTAGIGFGVDAVQYLSSLLA